MTAEELEKRIDELAHEFAKTHDEEVKAELESIERAYCSNEETTDLGRPLGTHTRLNH